MSIPTVLITCTAYGQNGIPLVGATFTFTLSHPEVYNGLVVPTNTVVTTNSLGIATANLFPNELGTTSHYIVVGKSSNIFLKGKVFLPNSNSTLEELFEEVS